MGAQMVHRKVDMNIIGSLLCTYIAIAESANSLSKLYSKNRGNETFRPGGLLQLLDLTLKVDIVHIEFASDISVDSVSAFSLVEIHKFCTNSSL